MLQFKEIGIEFPEVILTREDVYLQRELLTTNPIPLEVSYLDDNCFRNNDDFNKIVIHKKIKAIGKDCFFKCKAEIINKSPIKFD